MNKTLQNLLLLMLLSVMSLGSARATNYISDVATATFSSYNDAKAALTDAGYTVLTSFKTYSGSKNNGDIDQGCNWGYYTLVGYKTTTNESDAIGNLIIQADQTFNSSYTVGSYIYNKAQTYGVSYFNEKIHYAVYYTKTRPGANTSENLVTGIDVFGGSGSSTDCDVDGVYYDMCDGYNGTTNSNAAQDLNAGCGHSTGHYMYIGMTKTTHSHSQDAYLNNDSYHWYKCSCGYEYTTKTTHTLSYKDNGDGTHTASCSICGYSDTATHPIAYTDNGNGKTHAASCPLCSYTKSEAHVLTCVENADGTQSFSCKSCSYVEYTGKPLCFTAQEAGSTVTFNKYEYPNDVDLEYFTEENGKWEIYYTGTTMTLANVGDKVYLRARTPNVTCAHDEYNYHKFSMTGKIAASGDVTTLLNRNGTTSVPEYAFVELFDGCSALTSAPELPATTLAHDCYKGMFSDCTSLTEAPELPAENLAEYCYMDMFYGCTNLKKITANFSGWSNGTYDWLKNASPSGTFYCSSMLDITNFTRSTSTLPEGWSPLVLNKMYTISNLAEEIKALNESPSTATDYDENGTIDKADVDKLAQMILNHEYVKIVYVDGISMNMSSKKTHVGETINLQASVTPTDATNAEISWRSDNTSVATVDQNGVVTTLGIGYANIIATAFSEDGAISDSCKVSVMPEINPNVLLQEGEIKISLDDTDATITIVINNTKDANTGKIVSTVTSAVLLGYDLTQYPYNNYTTLKACVTDNEFMFAYNEDVYIFDASDSTFTYGSGGDAGPGNCRELTSISYNGTDISTLFDYKTWTPIGGTKNISYRDIAWCRMWDGSPKWINYSGEDPKFYTSSETFINTWEGDCRKPTKAEFQALMDNCDVSWHEDENSSDYNYVIFTGRGRYMGNTIKLYASGLYEDEVLTQKGTNAVFWTSDAAEDGYVWGFNASKDSQGFVKYSTSNHRLQILPIVNE